MQSTRLLGKGKHCNCDVENGKSKNTINIASPSSVENRPVEQGMYVYTEWYRHYQILQFSVAMLLCKTLSSCNVKLIVLLQCSVSCGTGKRTRMVECISSKYSSTCDESMKPEEFSECTAMPCPFWNYGQWSIVRCFLAYLF